MQANKIGVWKVGFKAVAQPLDRVIDQMTTDIANFGTTVNNTQTSFCLR